MSLPRPFARLITAPSGGPVAALCGLLAAVAGGLLFLVLKIRRSLLFQADIAALSSFVVTWHLTTP